MTFHVGQKVVCVVDQEWMGRPMLVVRDRIYTIATAFEAGGEPCVTLFEVAVPEYAPGWHSRCFRPIVKKKTDISIFTAMLDLDSSVIGESVPQTALSPEQQKEEHAS